MLVVTHRSREVGPPFDKTATNACKGVVLLLLLYPVPGPAGVWVWSSRRLRTLPRFVSSYWCFDVIDQLGQQGGFQMGAFS